VEEAVENEAGGLVLRGEPVGVLELPQDLGFPHDHGVEAGGDPEDVPDGVDVGEGVDAIPEGFHGHLVELGEEVEDVFRVGGIGFEDSIDLHPVAGGEDGAFLHAFQLLEESERVGELRLLKGELLPNLHRGGFVVQADNGDEIPHDHRP